MRYFSKALLANGLALAVGPFCFLATTHAQDYIDVEAERAAESANPSSSSTVQPAESYPVTSYGIGSAPAAPVLQGESPAAPVGSASGNAGQLLLKVQQLQQEVMRLNGLVWTAAWACWLAVAANWHLRRQRDHRPLLPRRRRQRRVRRLSQRPLRLQWHSRVSRKPIRLPMHWCAASSSTRL